MTSVAQVPLCAKLPLHLVAVGSLALLLTTTPPQPSSCQDFLLTWHRAATLHIFPSLSLYVRHFRIACVLSILLRLLNQATRRTFTDVQDSM